MFRNVEESSPNKIIKAIGAWISLTGCPAPRTMGDERDHRHDAERGQNADGQNSDLPRHRF
jgi:hypothetical protein